MTMEQILAWILMVMLGTAALVASMHYFRPQHDEWQDLVASVDEARRDFS